MLCGDLCFSHNLELLRELSNVCIDIDKFTCVLNRKERGKEEGRECISSDSVHLIIYEMRS